MKTILLIEDENDLREEIEMILKYEGFQVLQTDNGANGLEIAVNYFPDLILCDILMPQMSGFEVLKALKENQKTLLIPFVFITALDERKNLRTGMELGADDYLLKPFTRDELLNTIHTRFTKVENIEQELNSIRERIIHTIPHEMRTPLNAILGFGEILQEKGTNFRAEEIVDFGSSIVESGNRLYEIIQKYLMFIDIETKYHNLHLTHVHIFPHYIKIIAEKIAEKYNRRKDYSIDLEIFEANLKEEWILFALQEIMDNAFKFSEPGKQVKLLSKKTNNNIVLIIQDEGRGFSQENLKKINAFEQFNREIFEQQGVGLGLYLAKQIIELHKGTFMISSTHTKGTSVYLSLPIIS